MKHIRITALLLLLPLLLSLSSCGLFCKTLYEVERDGLTYCVRGIGSRPYQLVVKVEDHTVWKTNVHVNRKLDNYKGTYGMEIMDLDFDGTADIVLTTALKEEVTDVACYLWSNEKSTFLYSEELSALHNVASDDTLHCLFGFDHSYEYRKATADSPDTYVWTDCVTKYVWIDGILTPERRVCLAYDSEHKFYIYSIENYNTEQKVFEEPQETYLSEEEFAAIDFSFFYYFR